MIIGRQTGARRAACLALAGSCLAIVGCQKPEVGGRAVAASEPAGPRIVVTDSIVQPDGRVIATFTLSEDGRPLGPAEADALSPRFTLATLGVHPGDGFPAWRSHVLNGATVPPVPITHPNDPVPVTTTVGAQPGAETWMGTGADRGTVTSVGNGRFRYAFSHPIAGFDPEADATTTVRVGAWLDGVEVGTSGTSSTHDFRPDGGAPQDADAVLDDRCATCHGTLVHHERQSGVRLCVTCHTWQNVDPDTADPAARHPASRATDPNPLELGRLLHRIHRGKDLPTLYGTLWDPSSTVTALRASSVPSAAGLPRPFQPNRSGSGASQNKPVLGRKYSVIAENGHERVYAQSLTVTTVDPTPLGTMTIVAGGMFPRDLRDCAVCHGGAPRADVVKEALSRRTCSGCHPEVWYHASSPAADRVRFPHLGGPQPDDALCEGCHVAGAAKVYAPVVEIHVPPTRAPRYDRPLIEIRKVEDLEPGKRPKVTYRLSDRVGPIAPIPNDPQLPPGYTPDPATTSNVPRKLTSLVLRIMGPSAPDYLTYSSVQLGTEGGVQCAAVNDPPGCDPLKLATVSGTDDYVYTFTSTIPEGATGTYVVGIEARRALTVPAAQAKTNRDYDKTNDVFRWPYTGEALSEAADNALVYVNAASGVWPPPPGSPAPVPRRTVVDEGKCLRCHDRIEFHGARNAVAWCITCHTPDRTDWEKRKLTTNAGDGQTVYLGKTYDGIEERSTHLKMMIHRTHTGSRKGVSSLEGIAPYAVYYGGPYFFDRGGFPNDLRNCTVCHEGKTYLLDTLPADASPTFANERAELWHGSGEEAHPSADEPAIPPMQAACTGCHATGATFSHVASKTVDGVETCASCHSAGAVSVEVAHGLAPLAGGAGTTFSSIAEAILVPRCATAACHSGSPPVAFPRLDAGAAHAALVGQPSQQAGMNLVEPGAPERSYLLFKLRADATSAGGSGLPMPTDGLLDPADIAAVEAWIANGAQND